MRKANRIRVLLVDDHPVVREGTRAVLASAGDIEVIGEAESAAQALRLVQASPPDVLLLDIRMAGGDGIDLARRIRELQLQVKIVVLTAYDLEPYVHAALRLGVEGYVLKGCSPREIVEAIRTAFDGGMVFTSKVGMKLVEGYLGSRPGGQDNVSELTSREKEVLQLLALGKGNMDIARELGISLRTVESHATNIYGKLGARSRAEAIAVAARRGLIIIDT